MPEEIDPNWLPPTPKSSDEGDSPTTEPSQTTAAPIRQPPAPSPSPPPRTAILPPAGLATQWVSTLVSGVLTVILGILLLLWPGLNVAVVVGFFGAYLLVSGIAQVVFAFSLRASGARVLSFLSGAASLVLAVLAFAFPFLGLYLNPARPVASSFLFKSVIAVGFILRGGATTVLAIRDPELPGRGRIIASGVVGLIGGIVVLALPTVSLAAVAFAACLCLMITGVLEIVSSFGLRKSAKAVEA